jgi:mRNA-degrading endonuclease toxin of MazEF toxin-antitoxin module
LTVRRGFVYALAVEGGGPGFEPPRATRVLVVSENPWNDAMSTSVIVPLYPLAELERPTTLLVAVDPFYADCSLVQSIDHDDLGDELGLCSADALAAVCAGLRIYLDVDDLLAQRIRRPPSVGRSDFWPRQREIYWGTRFGEQRERYATMPSDELNVRADHTVMLFLTSRDKRWRSRWQVPPEGGYVISGDIDQFGYDELEHRQRPAPPRLTRPEMAEVAAAVVDVLQL